MGISYNTSIVREGLVLYLDAANPKSYSGSGTAWYNLIDNSSFTSYGSPTFSINSFYFTGYKNFSKTGLSIPLTSEITMSCWYKQTAAGLGSPRLIETYQSGSTTYASHCLAIDTDGSIRCWLDKSGATNSRFITLDDPTAYLFNIWRNLSFTFSSPDAKLYVNGNVTQSASIVETDIDDINTIYVGAAQDTSNYFTGYISNVSIYNRALSASEIQQNFQATRSRYGI